MFKLRYLLPALLLVGAMSSASQAQSVPLTTTTYSVQVQYEHWTSGNTYWSTVFQTEDAEDAELMLDLLDSALENGTICEILNCNWAYIIRDVRVTSRTVWNFNFYQRRIQSPPYIGNQTIQSEKKKK